MQQQVMVEWLALSGYLYHSLQVSEIIKEENGKNIRAEMKEKRIMKGCVTGKAWLKNSGTQNSYHWLQ